MKQVCNHLLYNTDAYFFNYVEKAMSDTINTSVINDCYLEMLDGLKMSGMKHDTIGLINEPFIEIKI